MSVVRYTNKKFIKEPCHWDNESEETIKNKTLEDCDMLVSMYVGLDDTEYQMSSYNTKTKVVWCGNYFLIVPSNNSYFIYYANKSNLSKWYSATLGGSGGDKDACYGKQGTLVVYGYPSYSYSTAVDYYNSYTRSTSPTYSWQYCCYDDFTNKYYVMDRNLTVARIDTLGNTSLTSYNSATTFSGPTIKGMCAGNGIIVIYFTSARYCIYSTDNAQTWKRSDFSSSNVNISKMVYGGGKFILFRQSVNLYYTEDFSSWQQISYPNTSRTWTDFCYDGNQFIGVGQGQVFLLKSKDGITWKEEPTLDNARLWGAIACSPYQGVIVTNQYDNIVCVLEETYKPTSIATIIRQIMENCGMKPTS